MSKKKNKKFKKQRQSSHIQPVHRSESQPLADGTIRENTTTEDSSPQNEKKNIEAKEQSSEEQIAEHQYKYVKKDVKRVLIYVVLMILILAAVYVLSIKTSVFSSFGDWVYKLLNIQTG